MSSRPCSSQRRDFFQAFLILGSLKLAVVHIGVKAVFPEEFLMFSLLNDASVIHDQDHIRFPDGGQSVGNNETGPIVHHIGKGRLNFHFRPCIDAACRFIENQHGRKAEQDSGDTEQLFLSLTDVAAVF